MTSEKLEGLDTTSLLGVGNTNEVSYAVLAVEPVNLKDVLEKFATTINLQLTLHQDKPFQFIPFNDFNKVKDTSRSFLYGPSGCGKSRCIYELVKEKLINFENILVINPRHTLGTKESGRANLTELLAKFGDQDALIWDNFPDDIIKTDIDNATKILEILGSARINSLLVALKPRYLEVYRDIPNKIFELYVHEIAYDRENFKSIIKFYGNNVDQFKEIYSKLVLDFLH